MTRIVVPFVVIMCAAALFSGGCSDDLVCPDLVPDGIEPFISADVAQRSDDRDGTTHAEVACTADPVPTLLIAFINGRELQDTGSSGDIGRLVTLDDDLVLWQPGVLCSLEVTTNFGYATASAVMPEATAVTAPAAISLGDTLKLSWEKSAGADYYSVSAFLASGIVKRGDEPSTARDTLALSAITRDTFVVFLPESVVVEGVVSGIVETVAGPFPESGTQGNVSGDGWGFFTLRYADAGSAFETAVTGALE